MSLKKTVLALSAAAAAAAVAFCVFAENSDVDRCIAFLDSYGWTVSPEVYDSAEVTIPAEFDEVYKSYNIIQREADLDLTPYRGMSGIRYTFVVTDYPVDPGEPVYANIICIGGEPVAGDIMTVSINGFMHSLRRL